MTRHFRRVLPFGAELIGPERTRFRLWAPSLQALGLVIEGRDDDIAMQRSDDGWFEAEVDCGAGIRYRYRVAPPSGGDALLVPDPASRAQAGDVNDPSIVVDAAAYLWQHDTWNGLAWRETVLYEIHPGLAGGFAGIRRLLPYLAEIGITAIELMPIADFTGARNWGYDGVLPFAPDASYGTPDELKAMIDDAHGLGLMVFLDVVYNHFGPDGNYIGLYAEPFFRDDVKTPWGRAIDFRRQEVRDFYCNNALYWIDEYRFDGLRLDATHSIVPQDWLGELAECVTSVYGGVRHVHLVVEHEGNASHLLGPHHGYDAQWNDDCHHVMHVLLTDETDGYYVDFATDPADKLARCLSEGFIYQGQPSPFRAGSPRGEPSRDLPPTAFVSFLQNHDQIGNRAFGERLVSLAHPDAYEAAFAMLLMLPHIPLLFMGEERNASEPFLFFTSFHDELAEAVREGRRGEFAGAQGFSDPEKRHTIPDPNDAATYERSRVDLARAPESPAEVKALERTKCLLDVRRRHIASRLEGARSLGAEAVGPKAVVARWHMGDGSVLTVATNLAAESVPMTDYRFRMRGEVLFATARQQVPDDPDSLPGHTTWAVLEAAAA